MGGEWRRVPISDVCELIVDCVNKTAPTVDQQTRFKMLRTPNVKGGRVSTDDCKYVTEDTFEKWTRRAKIRENDVLLTREAPLGEVGIVKSKENLFLGQRLMQYRANPQVLDAEFLVYSFLSPDLQNQFRMHEGSGSVVSHIRVGDCSKFELNIPTLPEQKRIARILSTLDRKIELNTQINTTLESMAQALFKSWFVDFDPVIDNAIACGNPIPDELSDRAERRQALKQSPNTHFQPLPTEIQQLFPNNFVLTEEMGWVPEGWEIKRIDDLLELAYGKALPATVRVNGAFPVYGSGGVSGYHNEAIVRGPGIVVGRKGTVGSLYWVEEDFFPIDTVFYVQNKTDLPMFWLFKILQTLDIASMGADSAVPGVNRNTVYAQKVIVPQFHSLNAYGYFINIFKAKQNIVVCENGTLSVMRDELLPKLLSGQIQIPEAEALLNETL